jgi:hypothetical protein
MDFQSVLQEAIAIKISEERGDWSLPTPQEIGREAASLMGVAPPISWRPPKEVEPAPMPPEKLVDEVSTTNLEGKTPKTLEGSWKVVGDSGAVWEVSKYSGEVWKCSCPAFQNRGVECKHISDVIRKSKRSPAPSPERLPELTMPPPGIAPIFKPFGSEANTKIPDGGLLIGGGPPPPEADPWALPPTAAPLNERVIPVGGKIQFRK